ncbi:MAG: hypothetical protein QM820_13145 [Minicystis sp.]
MFKIRKEQILAFTHGARGVVHPCSHCLILRFTEIKGLYAGEVDDRKKPPPGTTKNASYVPGYASEDGRGRIYINHLPDGTWEKNKQYIEITVSVEPPSVPIPPGSKITWSFEDPDDPSNEDRRMHRDTGKLLDPNDYLGSWKIGAKEGDNDPYKKAQEKARFEEADPKFALSGNETAIDMATRTSKVRFHVTDIAGDNYKIKAELKPIAPITATTPAETGVMTVWHKIQLEYVKMASADELPVDQIARYYDRAFAQVDVSLKREVKGKSDKPFMGRTEQRAFDACEDLATKERGEFTMDGKPGWFFIASANRFLPEAHTRLLYEGEALAFGNKIKLPQGTIIRGEPVVVRVFNRATISGMPRPWPNDFQLHIKFRIRKVKNQFIEIEPHDFHEVHDPDNAFLKADLSHYGFAAGDSIPIQVLSHGDKALITGGISPGGVDIKRKHFFGGRLIIFTKAVTGPEVIRTLCHELCHAFDNAHKCGNWDWINQTDRTSCCMNYWYQFVLDEANPRAPIAWTQNRSSPEMCGPHLRRIRDYHLEDNPGLRWGGP